MHHRRNRAGLSCLWATKGSVFFLIQHYPKPCKEEIPTNFFFFCLFQTHLRLEQKAFKCLHAARFLLLECSEERTSELWLEQLHLHSGLLQFMNFLKTCINKSCPGLWKKTKKKGGEGGGAELIATEEEEEKKKSSKGFMSPHKSVKVCLGVVRRRVRVTPGLEVGRLFLRRTSPQVLREAPSGCFSSTRRC